MTKISVTIDEKDLSYIDEETRAGRFASRSAALQAAVRVLHERGLADAYAAAYAEWESDEWDAASRDGLDSA